MYKFIFRSMAVAVSVFGISQANASIVTFDNFDYSDGPLVGNGGWANHSGNPGDLLVSGGQVVVQHGVPSEDANLAFSSVVGEIYYGIDFSVDSIETPDWGSDNEYFAHFKDDGFGFAARLDVVGPTDGGDFTVGISSDDSTADVLWATDLAFDTSYRAVVRYDQVSNVAELWIDASDQSDTSIVGDEDGNLGDTVLSFALRQSDSDNNETVRVDGLVVGTTFGDVVNVVVPEPTTFALGGLGLLALLTARRRS